MSKMSNCTNNKKRKHNECHSSYAMTDIDDQMARPIQRRRRVRNIARPSRKRSYEERPCEKEEEWTRAPTKRSRYSLAATSVSRPIDQDDLCQRMGKLTIDKSLNERVHDICLGMRAMTFEKSINERLDDLCEAMGALEISNKSNKAY